MHHHSLLTRFLNAKYVSATLHFKHGQILSLLLHLLAVMQYLTHAICVRGVRRRSDVLPIDFVFLGRYRGLLGRVLPVRSGRRRRLFSHWLRKCVQGRLNRLQ